MGNPKRERGIGDSSMSFGISREATTACSCGRQPADPVNNFNQPRSGGSKRAMLIAGAASRLAVSLLSILRADARSYMLSPLRG